MHSAQKAKQPGVWGAAWGWGGNADPHGQALAFSIGQLRHAEDKFPIAPCWTVHRLCWWHWGHPHKIPMIEEEKDFWIRLNSELENFRDEKQG